MTCDAPYSSVIVRTLGNRVLMSPDSMRARRIDAACSYSGVALMDLEFLVPVRLTLTNNKSVRAVVADLSGSA